MPLYVLHICINNKWISRYVYPTTAESFISKPCLVVENLTLRRRNLYVGPLQWLRWSEKSHSSQRYPMLSNSECNVMTSWQRGHSISCSIDVSGSWICPLGLSSTFSKFDASIWYCNMSVTSNIWQLTSQRGREDNRRWQHMVIGSARFILWPGVWPLKVQFLLDSIYLSTAIPS